VVGHQRASDSQPLFLASGKLAHARPRLLLELHHRHHVRHRRPALVEAAEQVERLFDRELVGELSFLKLDAQPLPQTPRAAGPVDPQKLDRPGVRRQQPLADFDGGGLSGAVRPEQREALARAGVEVDPIHRHYVAVSLAQPPQAQGGLAVRHSSRGAQNQNLPQHRSNFLQRCP